MPSLTYRIEQFSRGVRFRLTRRLRDREPSDLWPGIERICVRQRPYADRFGNVKPHELTLLCALARLLRPRAIFEFGTFDGLTAWHLAANAGLRARVWTLDLPPDHPARFAQQHDRSVGAIQGVAVGSKFIDTPQAARISQLFGDSLQFDPTPFRNSIDLCFIDAGHFYEHVRCDTENALQMMRPGGVIVWHDYSRWWPGVQRCLDDLSRRLPVCRVAGTALAALQLPGPAPSDERGDRALAHVN
jgi:predicted O-methyltransferase YrrM